jgi:hypothetical protein
MEPLRGSTGEQGARGEAAAVQREGEAVAGERWDDCGLVADGIEVFGDGMPKQ